MDLSVNGEIQALPPEPAPQPSRLEGGHSAGAQPPRDTRHHSQPGRSGGSGREQLAPPPGAGGQQGWDMAQLEEMMLQEAMARSLEASEREAVATAAAAPVAAPADTSRLFGAGGGASGSVTADDWDGDGDDERPASTGATLPSSLAPGRRVRMPEPGCPTGRGPSRFLET
jgi:hypothetical protein